MAKCNILLLFKFEHLTPDDFKLCNQAKKSVHSFNSV